MEFEPEKIRNITILGHSGSGKTSLVESLAYVSGHIKELGSIHKKNTISDFLKIEHDKESSFNSSLVPIVYKGTKINLIDIPGNDDFIYSAIGVTKVVKGAVLLIDAEKGIEVETRKHWKLLRKRNIPTIIFINKMEKKEVDFPTLLEEIRNEFGKNVVPFSYPTGKENNFDGFVNTVDLVARKYNGVECVDEKIFEDKFKKIFNCHSMIVEAVASSSDELLEKFFDGGEITKPEIHKGLRKGVLDGSIIPILVGSAKRNIGSHTLLDMLVDYLSNPVDLKPISGTNMNGDLIIRKTSNLEPFSAMVFKTIMDPFAGQISFFKVYSGSIKIGDQIYCPQTDKTFRVNSLFTMFGKEVVTEKEVFSGDIACITKLSNVQNGFTLCDPKNIIKYKEIKYPTAVLFKSIKTRNKKDEDRIGTIFKKIMAEDPTIELIRNDETKELLIGCSGSTHLSYILENLKNNYKLELDVFEPRIVYRETINKKGKAIGRYIKQTGGSGHYAVTEISFEPNDNNAFAEKVYGGSVPRNYFQAVEKGVYEAFSKGLLCGYPVINVKATLLDGKYHPVDSDDLAFKNAAKEAFKNCYMECKPTVLEPIMKVIINCSNEYIGDILSDINTKRAQVQNLVDIGDNETEIECLVPEAEIADYANELKALTQGSGYFRRNFSKYLQVPDYLQDSVQKAVKLD